MKIAILTSGILPVPAVKGGAVENLTDFYLEYNNQHRLHDITVYSIFDEAVREHPALLSKVNHYHYIDTDSTLAKVRKRIFHLLHKHEEYYHYTIEYYLHQAIRHIRSQHYDLIILENRPAYALQLKKYTDAHLVYHLHNEKLDNHTPNFQDIYDAAYRIITVSDYIASRVKTININDTKCITVHNGIDLEAFAPDTKSTISRAALGLTEQDFLMVFSGRINRDKGIMELVEAMTLLKAYPAIKLLVIGSSFFGNNTSEDDFIKSLKDRAQELKGRIVFTGFIPYHQMPDYLRIADIAVIPSVWDDPFPTTVLEAQAMGLPIITTRRGGIPEEVTTDGAILLNTKENFVDLLATSIIDIYSHPNKRQAMSTAAKKRSLLFCKERYAEDFFLALASST